MLLLGRGTHLTKNLLAQSLLDLVDVTSGTGSFDSLLDGFGKAGNVAVKTVVDDGDLGHGWAVVVVVVVIVLLQSWEL